MAGTGYLSGTLDVVPGALYSYVEETQEDGDDKRHVAVDLAHSDNIRITLETGDIATVATLTTSAHADDILDTTGSHGLVAFQPIYFKALTGGDTLVPNVTYYVSETSLAATTFRVSAAASPDTPLTWGTTDITAGTVGLPVFVDNPSDGGVGDTFTLTVRNSTGATAPPLVWGDSFSFVEAFVPPADGESVTYEFAWDDDAEVWQDQSEPVPFPTPRVDAAYTIDCSKGLYHYLHPTANGAITIEEPVNPPDEGEVLTIDIHNESGGALTSVTFDEVFLFDTAPTKPASTKHLLVQAIWNGTNWVGLSAL